MPRVGAARQDLPEAIDDVIQRACAKDRGNRFRGCDELVAALVAAERAERRQAVPVIAPLGKTQPELPRASPPRVLPTVLTDDNGVRLPSSPAASTMADAGSAQPAVTVRHRNWRTSTALTILVLLFVAAVAIGVTLWVRFAALSVEPPHKSTAHAFELSRAPGLPRRTKTPAPARRPSRSRSPTEPDSHCSTGPNPRHRSPTA